MDLHVRGVVLPEDRARDVFVVDGRFTFDPPGDARTILDGGFLLPGLVDAHSHLGAQSPAGQEASPEEKVRASARAELEAGVLAIREPGGADRASIGVGPAEGLPRVFAAGRFLVAPGRMFPGDGRELREELIPQAAEEELRYSGGWVKLVADFPDADGRYLPSLGPETLAETARRVHAMGGRVAVHAFLPEVIEAAIDAEFDSIEHGVMARPDQAERMAERGIALVPTLSGLERWPAISRALGADADEVERIAAAIRGHPEVVRTAAEAGALILAGTDAGMQPHGGIGREIRALIGSGISPQEALAAASWRARAFLGLPGIEEGAPADLVAYERDPREDPDTLATPALVILDGTVIRSAERVR